MNMFKPTGAKTVKEYMTALAPERKAVIKEVDALIKDAAPNLKPHFAYNMLGYGSFKYKNYAKKIIDWPIVALASQKGYVSVYVCALEGGEYLAEKYKARLGKVSVGKSCIRFKKLEDVNLGALRTIVKKAAKKPGLLKA